MALWLLPLVSMAADEGVAPSPGAWPDKVLRWYYNPEQKPAWLDADAALQLVRRAASRWKACGVEIDYEGETSSRPGTMDGRNVVGWANGKAGQPRGLTVGKAKRGVLLERDIVFNSGRREFERAPRLLEKVIVHEFGHAIGLTHSSRCDDVMTLAADCPPIPPARLPIEPTSNDLARCHAIYD